jgi:hypothetical protein
LSQLILPPTEPSPFPADLTIDAGDRGALYGLLEWAAPKTDALSVYYWDPVGFAEECVVWPEGKYLRDHQREGLETLARDKRVSVRSMHSAGKTTFVGLGVLWFGLTRDAAGVPWKCPTTAGAWRQLEFYLWPEIHLWAQRLDWDKIGRVPFRRYELQTLNLKLRHGTAFAVASDQPALIEGVHADAVMYVFDESKSIRAATFDAAEGAFAAEGAEDIEALAIATSTPGEPNGRFWQIQTQQPGYEDWRSLHWTLERVMETGQVTQEWVDKRARQWGAHSAIFANRVLGEFHSADEDGVIPLSWIEAAVERWRMTSDLAGGGECQHRHTHCGVDVARSGEDKTNLAIGVGDRVCEIRTSFHEDTMMTAGRVRGVLAANPGCVAIIDTDGLGAGVTDRLREQEQNVYAFHAGESTDRLDKSGELGFLNVRAAAWWNLREMLDPANSSEVELPEDAELLGDLTAPHWTVRSNGRIQIEAKDEIKKRLGRSPDKGDAVVMRFWQERKRRRARMGDMGASPEHPHADLGEKRWVS